MADADSIYCLNPDLETIWATALPAEGGTKSWIILDNGKIRFFNYGVVFYNLGLNKSRIPFAAVYDSSTGRQLSFTDPELSKRFTGGHYGPGCAYWQDGDKIYYSYDGEKGSHQLKWKIKYDGESVYKVPKVTLCNTVYTLAEGFLKPIQSDSTQLVTEIYGRDVNVVKHNGECTPIPYNEVYFRDGRDIYSTNSLPGKPRNVVITEPGSLKIKYKMKSYGEVYMSPSGNIFINMKNGLVVIPAR